MHAFLYEKSRWFISRNFHYFGEKNKHSKLHNQTLYISISSSFWLRWECVHLENREEIVLFQLLGCGRIWLSVSYEMHLILRGSVLVLLIKWRFCDSLITYTRTWWLTITMHDPSSTCSFPTVTRITFLPLEVRMHFSPQWWYCTLAHEEEAQDSVVMGERA